MRKSISYITGFLLVLVVNVHAADWYHIKTEKSENYRMLADYYLNTSLGESGSDNVSVWVRTDYTLLEEKDFNLVRRRGTDKAIKFLWYKTRYIVSCGSQEINAADSHYMLSNEDIEWDERNPYHLLRIVPDTIHDVIYRLACDDGKPKSLSDIRRSAELTQDALLGSSPDPVNTESRIPPWKNIKSTPPNMQR